MFNSLLIRLIGSVASRLDGYKTKIGGFGFILLGLLGIIRIVIPDLTQLPAMTMEASLGLISAGITALGLGGKAEKQTLAIREQTAAVIAASGSASAVGIEKTAPSDG
ncbi:MAG: hypothetical protein M0024_01410 [Nitrospiraceae bacterium]|nr:hypothetical protein [Nitrospiraceae bacterium]